MSECIHWVDSRLKLYVASVPSLEMDVLTGIYFSFVYLPVGHLFAPHVSL